MPNQKNNIPKSNEELLKENEILTKKLESIQKHRQESTERKVWTGKKVTGFFIGKNLKDSLNTLYNELPNKVTKETLADVTTNIIWRFTRIGLFAMLVAFIPYVLLYQQNSLLEQQNIRFDKQNELFANQNSKIEIQTELLEADRRSALVFLMSNIMDKVDSELKNDWNDDKIRNLSPELIGRTMALAYSFKPYRFLEDDSLISKPLSPERGQLLLALVNVQIDSNCTFQVLRKCSFISANLKRAGLRNANLRGVNLQDANLEQASLIGANLVDANLNWANLEEATLMGANLDSTYLIGANLKGVYLKDSNLRGAYLIGANLERASLEGAFLGQADLMGANLKGTFLREVNLEGANLERVNLEGVTISNKDWINQLDIWNVSGRQEIKENYFINEVGGGSFILTKKN